MVSFTKQQQGMTKTYVEGFCLSTDSKPTDVANGSIMIEINTGKVCIFNEAGSTWVDQFSLQD